VPALDTAFATVASVALHRLRLAEVGPGAKVVVLGLGLLGQLAVRLARAAGCDVAGIDVGEFPVHCQVAVSLPVGYVISRTSSCSRRPSCWTHTSTFATGG
jgi:D-arabinose 1-dehydrogenase-like Zn-dependent alcohol dehydrogenase